MSESNSIEKNIKKFKRIEEEFLNFLEDEENIEEKFKKLNQLFDDTKIKDQKHDLRLFLRMLVKISNNHHCNKNFFSKIKQILQIFKDEIKKYKNSEIFTIFKSNKRILLYLIEESILTVNEYFVKQIIEGKYLEKKYPQYFAPEIKQFMSKSWFPKYDPNEYHLKENKWVEDLQIEIPDNFYEMRQEGENESYICKMIREDAAEEFVAYISQANISPNSIIVPSIFETNSFLLSKQIQSDKGIPLIFYAAFFGSIQIFNFLKNEGAKLNQSLWIYAIHSNNAELIHLLESNDAKPTEALAKNYFKESIKCHHNNIANYFLANYLKNEDENTNDTFIQSLKYYNFAYLQNEHINETSFHYICLYDYYFIAKYLLADKNIDINSKAIQNQNLQLHSESYFLIKFVDIFFNNIQYSIFL